MGKALQRRNLLLQKRIKLKLQARKFNSPTRGLKQSLEQQNNVVLDRIVAQMAADKQA